MNGLSTLIVTPKRLRIIWNGSGRYSLRASRATQDKKAAVLERYRAGDPVKWIYEEYRIDAKALSRWRQDAGIPRRKKYSRGRMP